MSTTLTIPDIEMALITDSIPMDDVIEKPAVAPAKSNHEALIETYLRLIDGQNRRLTAYETAMEAERNQLEDMPGHIADLQSRLSMETSPDLVDVLRAKLEEARADFGAMQRRVASVEAAWPMKKAEMLADIAGFEEKLAQIGYIAA